MRLVDVRLGPTTALGSRLGATAAGLLADRAFGEPPTAVHPVVWFGTAMQRTEQVLWGDRRINGIVYATTGTALGWIAGRLLTSTTAAVALSVAGRALRTTAKQVGTVVASGDLDRARTELPSLVGRDPSELDASGIAAAVIESVAENSVDAMIAPVFWGVVAGAPGTACYRAINTMDAMVGHHNERYENFGWATAKLDDVANYIPARIFAALVAVQTPKRAASIFRLVRRDAPAHPSPNAGVAETAVAASIGVELGGPLRYGDQIENRPTLGQGQRPRPADIDQAIAVANRAELIALTVLGLGWLLKAGRNMGGLRLLR